MSANLRIGLLFFLALLVGAMWLATFASKRQERVIAGVAPLETQHFDALTLIALGSGGSFENHQRRGPALLVGAGESALLVDAGRGVSEALRATGVPVQQPRHVLLSSLLPENVLGLDDLWLDAWLARPRAALHVYGPPGTARFVAELQRTHATGARALQNSWALDAAGGRIVAHEVADGARFAVGALRVVSAALPGGALPALAWRITQAPTSPRNKNASADDAARTQSDASPRAHPAPLASDKNSTRAASASDTARPTRAHPAALASDKNSTHAASASDTVRPTRAHPAALASDKNSTRTAGASADEGHAIVTAFGGNDAEATARIARGAAIFAVEAVYGASLALAEEAGLPNLPVLRREAALHPRLEDIGALATRAGVQAIVLLRLRPPPVFAFQYERLVAQNFRHGPVFVAADGDRFTP